MDYALKLILESNIKEHLNSEAYKLSTEGDEYYKVNNTTIGNKVNNYIGEGNVTKESPLSNNKLKHATYKNLVDEKISYLLGKEFTIEEDGTELSTLLTDNYDRLLDGCYNASNNGISWLHPYYNEQGELKIKFYKQQEIIPIFCQFDSDILEGIIRMYSLYNVSEKGKEEVIKVEYWTDKIVQFYEYKDKKLIVDSEKYLELGIMDGDCGHYIEGNKWTSWGKVPFIPIRNNRLLLPDLYFIKSLIDNYDISRSEVANYVQDCKNLVYVLKGYGGQDLGKVMDKIQKYRAISIPDADGSMEALNPNMDITSLKEHYEQLKRDIVESGQGVFRDIDKLGNGASGTVLKMLYSGLELKCDIFARYLTKAINELSYFVYGQDKKIKVAFNKDMAFNETEVIDNILKSTSILSRETLVKMHPWVDNLEDELNLINADKEENLFAEKEVIEEGVN